jgi:predicted transposase/invertase (TIGR01784 family)
MTFTRYLNPRNDVAFKRIFGMEKNKDILLDFLNDILNKQGKETIVSISFLNPALDPSILAEKRSIVDVLCEDQLGRRYIVEMQVANVRGFEKRAQYYAARAYCNQIKTGEAYHDLKEIIFLAITNFVMFPDKLSYLSRHIMLDQTSFEHNLKDFSFTFIELPKFTKAVNELMTDVEKWCYFFKHADEIENIDHLIAYNDPMINKAYQELLACHWNDEELARYEATDKIIRDNRAREEFIIEKASQEGLEKGLQQGIEKGIEKGRQEGILKIAQNLLAVNTDLTLIAQVTGLSIEQIEALRN